MREEIVAWWRGVIEVAKRRNIVLGCAIERCAPVKWEKTGLRCYAPTEFDFEVIKRNEKAVNLLFSQLAPALLKEATISFVLQDPA